MESEGFGAVMKYSFFKNNPADSAEKGNNGADENSGSENSGNEENNFFRNLWDSIVRFFESVGKFFAGVFRYIGNLFG